MAFKLIRSTLKGTGAHKDMVFKMKRKELDSGIAGEANNDGTILFDDLLFNGQNKNLSVYSYIEYISWSVLPITLDYIHVNLFNVSEATHLYKKTYSIHQNTSGNPFAQAVQVYSNITNGFGIFGGAQIDTFSF